MLGNHCHNGLIHQRITISAHLDPSVMRRRLTNIYTWLVNRMTDQVNTVYHTCKPLPMANTLSPASLFGPTTHDSNLALYKLLTSPRRFHRLPPEIVLQILSYPSRWLLSSIRLEDAVTVANFSDRLILNTAPFNTHKLSHLRKIVFKFSSHDQGWSSFAEDHGTFRNSWSYFEVGLLSGGIKRLREEQAQPPRKSSLKRRWTLQHNRHAGKEFEEYTVEIDAEHDMMREMKVGDVVVLLACAHFPGWTNSVKEAEIQVWSVDRLDEERCGIR